MVAAVSGAFAGDAGWATTAFAAAASAPACASAATSGAGRSPVSTGDGATSTADGALGIAKGWDIDPEIQQGGAVVARELIDLVCVFADLDQLPEAAAITFCREIIG